jgi:hypothetical protein
MHKQTSKLAREQPQDSSLNDFQVAANLHK